MQDYRLTELTWRERQQTTSTDAKFSWLYFALSMGCTTATQRKQLYLLD